MWNKIYDTNSLGEKNGIILLQVSYVSQEVV